MKSDRYLEAVASNLDALLHTSTTGYRCRCGSCRHRIVVAARRTGIRPERIISALPPERPREQKPVRRRRPARLTSQVSGAMTVSSDGRQYQGVDAVYRLIAVE